MQDLNVMGEATVEQGFLRFREFKEFFGIFGAPMIPLDDFRGSAK